MNRVSRQSAGRVTGTSTVNRVSRQSAGRVTGTSTVNRVSRQCWEGYWNINSEWGE